MKRMKPRLFGRIFLYTLLFLSAAIAVFAFFYARQLGLAFALYERRQLSHDVQRLLGALEEKTRAEKIEAIAGFGVQNGSFALSLRTNTGEILYESPDFTMHETSLKDLLKNDGIPLEGLKDFDFGFSLPVDDNVTLYIARYAKPGGYTEVMKGILPLSLLLLGISAAGAFVFARLMSKPIKRLARDTVKMAKLEDVMAPPPRSDEIGLLAENVHSMYALLKNTIASLENEIALGKELEEKQRYFFKVASHELKTPVAAATAILEALIGKVIEADKYPEYFHKCLQMMKAQGKLSAEILDIVRLDEGKITPKSEDINLSVLLASVLPSCQALSESKNQSITISLPDTACCKCDRYMLGRVLSNILMNAVQNSPEGEEIRIWSEALPGQEGVKRLRLCILNTNAKIGEAVMTKIYEPFYRADEARCKNQGGSGLGLAIVKKALNSMEIPFAMENRDGGVLFWMDLPSA